MQAPLPRPRLLQPLDRIAILTILILGVLIGLMLGFGDRAGPRVGSWNWQNKQIGAEDTAFVLTFSRPMDQVSVEQNLQIGPPLPGKTSWAGRRMVYTLDAPAPYGTQYQISIRNGKENFVSQQQGRFEPFNGQFRTRDRAFAYIGVEGDEAGRLVLYNFTRQQKQVLTPSELTVIDFKFYPAGRRILFSAIERQQTQELLAQKLYSVTTGLVYDAPTAESQGFFPAKPLQPEVAVQIKPILDNRDYQNLKFDISADGQTIVVQRVNRKKPGEFGLWIVREEVAPQPLKNEPGGDFRITPDSNTIVMTQGQGLAILPLTPASEPLEFLPKYGQLMSFSSDGGKAAMVQFNQGSYLRSLVLVTNQGDEQELMKVNGSILAAEFDPTGQILYALLTQVVPGKTYQEQPYIVAIHLSDKKVVPLLKLPVGQRDINVSLSPDGLTLLLDQVIHSEENRHETAEGTSVLQTVTGNAISTSRLWLLALDQDVVRGTVPVKSPEVLPLPGLHPQWLP
jgi:hypothetical protein